LLLLTNKHNQNGEIHMALADNHDFRLTTLAAAVALPLAMGSHHTSAQALQLEEVLVTAQKRSESVQDIPSTVNVIDGDALKDFNVLSFNDLGALTAGLEITSFNGRSGRMSMRGIDFNPNSAAEATVTTYWNQAVVDSNAVFQQMFDVQRVEVLRGPQGTLAGRTSPAGAINIHTARPNMEEMEGEFRGTVTDNDGLNTQVAASFPIIPGQLAVRVAGVYNESDGDEIENDVTGAISGDETTAGRFSLSWLPTDSFSVDFAVQYLDREFDDVVALDGVPSGDPRLDPEGLLSPLDAYDRRGAVVGMEGIEDNTSADFLNSSLVLEWELGSHTITSVTGYHETESTREYDQSTGSANPDNVARRVAIDERDDFSQELRFASDGNETWDYMVGAYFEDSDIYFSQENHQIPVSPLAPGSFDLQFPAQAERWGLFTHNQFYLSEAWTLQVGLRYQEIEVDRDMSVYAGADGIAIYPPGALIDSVLSEENQKYEDDSVTGQVTLQYALNDDVNLYALVGTGWRPGGVTVTGTALPEDVLLFDSEESTSYELGFKSKLLGGAMRLNGSLYYQDFEDYISRVNALNIRGLDGEISTSGVTVNGDAEVWGAELDLTAILRENWYLGGTLSYTKSEFSDGTELPCNEFDDNGAPVIPDGQFTASCDVGGEPIGSEPDWTASINSEYSIPFGSVEGYGRILYTYTGDRDADIDGVDSYHIVNLYLGVRAERWNVELFSTNLFDEEALRGGGGTEATPLVRRVPTGYGWRFPVAGQRIGLTASYRW
jgi:iron complex outermembrane recepter protein